MTSHEHASSTLDRPANSTTGQPINKARSLGPRVLAAVLAASAGLAVQLGGERTSTARQEAAGPQPRLVQVAAVRPAPEHRQVRFSGLVRARQRGKLAFTMGGRMVRRPAQIGMQVDKGDLLASLDTAPLLHARRAAQARLRDADARIAQLERDVARAERLLDKKAGVQEAVEKTRAARDAAHAARDGLAAQLAEAQRQLREARLTAPFSGTVLDVMLEAGETASPGAPVVVLSAEDQLEVEVQVPEYIRARIAADARVQVDLPLAGLEGLEGRIRQLGRAASGPGALFPVIVQLSDAPENIVPGFTADVRLQVRRPGGQLVPVPAVSDPGGKSPFVYRVEGGVARRVPVTVRGLAEGGVVVQSALGASDMVIVRGHTSLLPGEPVKVQR